MYWILNILEELLMEGKISYKEYFNLSLSLGEVPEIPSDSK